MVNQITTSTASTATAYSNQRKIDRTSNGVLWAFHKGGVSDSYAVAYYSTDNGATWTDSGTWGWLFNSGTSTTYAANFSIFIDADDYAHLVFKAADTGFIYYRRGTPNAGRTAWTWSAALEVIGATTRDHPDIVAFRNGTGWVAHIVFWSSLGNVVAYGIDITSGGVASVNNVYATTLGSGVSTTISAYPSIDFNHTGDGKTVAGSTPHLYAAWSAGATGAGKGIRFKKATYSAGTWTWGTEREIDSTQYVISVAYFVTCLFDGTRVIIGGQVHDGTNENLRLYERDVADTITTVYSLLSAQTTATTLRYGSMTYDNSGNVYLFGRNSDEAVGSRDFVYRKWTRNSASLDAEVVIDSGVGDPYVSAKRGFSDSKIEFIYTDGSGSPYTITFGMVQLNRTPTVVNPVAPGAVGKGDPLTVNWTYSDLDNDPQSKYQIRWRKIL